MTNPLKIQFDSKRVYGLDILRAVAIISVMFAHAGKLLPESVAKFQDNFLVDGVFLFFVLSGFLIGGILIKILENHKANLKSLTNFWVRRWFRTLPNFFLVLTVLVILANLLHGGVHDTSVWRYFLFVQNFAYPHPEFFSEAWTLSVEEWFYLIIPALTFAVIGIFRIKPKSAILLVALTVMIAAMGFRTFAYTTTSIQTIADWDAHLRKVVLYRLDSLMFGILGAYLAYYYKSLWIKHKKILFGMGLAIVASQQIIALYIAGSTHFTQWGWRWYISIPYFTIMALGILMLLPLLSDIKSGKGRIYTSLTYVSIISYSMYLIHVSLVQPFVIWLMGQQTSYIAMFVRYTLYWAITLTVSILMYNYFEKPTTGLREKIKFNRFKRSKERLVLEPETNSTVSQ